MVTYAPAGPAHTDDVPNHTRTEPTLAIPARTRLARLLAGESEQTSQSAMLRLPAEVLDLHVDGVGAVPLPVRAPLARKLIAASTPAHFGRGEETLLDAAVRDTGEITPGRVTLSGERWLTSLADALERLGTRLGVQDPRRLRAELHSLLVYGKGQFFAPHQDSEKHDDMVATLVVMLPSSHTGGELLISDQGDSKVYTGSTHELTFVAFYPDCRHEVLPVRSGWRVALTFNVLLDELPDAEPAGPLEEVAALLREHFETPVHLPYRTRDGDPPQRLAVPARARCGPTQGRGRRAGRARAGGGGGGRLRECARAGGDRRDLGRRRGGLPR